jgi:hypothetical protein
VFLYIQPFLKKNTSVLGKLVTKDDVTNNTTQFNNNFSDLFSPGFHKLSFSLCEQFLSIESGELESIPIFIMYDESFGAWGSKGIFYWKNIMFKYAVDVVSNHEHPDEPFFKYRISINSIQMHNHEIEQMIIRTFNTIRQLELALTTCDDINGNIDTHHHTHHHPNTDLFDDDDDEQRKKRRCE